MQPVKHEHANVVYKGNGEDIGDLWVQRTEPGQVVVVYDLDDRERAQIAGGGRIALVISTEPIPPVALAVIDERIGRPIEPHPAHPQG